MKAEVPSNIQVLKNASFGLLITSALLVAIVPFYPTFFPQVLTLEGWTLALNVALSEGMAIGKDIIFTYGPYASLATRMYHPAVDSLTFYASAYLALACGLILISLSKYYSKLAILGIALLILSLNVQDYLFLWYPLLVVIYTLTTAQNTRHNNYSLFEYSLIFSVLGLLTLIKGSFLLSTLFTLLLLSLFLYPNRYYRILLILWLAPLIGIPLFWLLSGQELRYLFAYFASLLPIVAGYTEAMALNLGPTSEVILFLIIAITIILAWAVPKQKVSGLEKLIIFLAFASFLFVAFKAGFVRHDEHAAISIYAALAASLTLCMISPGLISIFTFCSTLSVCSWIIISHSLITPTALFANYINGLEASYSRARTGIYLRIMAPNHFKEEHSQIMANIKTQNGLTQLNGGTDIFSYNQVELFATQTTWNPRPIFQSYSVYTKDLALLNEMHFRQPNAPDNVIFRVQPVDNRLPALEDGAAWMALADNYTVDKILNNAIYLKKNPTLIAQNQAQPFRQMTAMLGKSVTLPPHQYPVYAEIVIKPTWLGKLKSLFYKPSPLTMKLTLADGSQKQFHVLSNMMQSPFLLSPLVDNTKYFLFFVSGQLEVLQSATVKSFAIEESNDGMSDWQPSYTINLKQYKYHQAAPLPEHLFNTKLNQVPDMIDLKQSVTCEAYFDTLYGFNPQGSSPSAGIIGMNGWFAKSMTKGEGVDDIYLLINKAGQKSIYIKALRSSRPDVKTYFKQPAMKDVGFELDADMRALKGVYQLQLAFSLADKYYTCSNLKFPINLGNK